MQLKAPDNIASFNFDGVEYHPDDNGLFNIEHPDHIASAQMHGATPYDPNAPAVNTTALEIAQIVDGDHADHLREALTNLGLAEDDLKTANDTIATLNSKLDAETKRADDAEKALAAVKASGGGSGSGDTSEGTGGGTEDPDKATAAALLASKPDTDDYGAMKTWLADAGVSVPGNVSKDAAKAAVETRVAELEKKVA